MGLSTKDRLIVALDYDTMAEVERLLDRLQGQVSFYKVGLQLFSRNGPRVIQYLVDQGAKVFADLKLHDIPNTVAKATRALTALGVNIIDVHVSGGTEMMRAAAKATAPAGSTSRRLHSKQSSTARAISASPTVTKASTQRRNSSKLRVPRL